MIQPDGSLLAPLHLTVDGRDIEYRIQATKSGRRLRIRVGVGGVDVIRPPSVGQFDAEAFLRANARWVVDQLDRLARLQAARRLRRVEGGTMLYRGEAKRLCVEEARGGRAGRIEERDGALVIITREGSRTTPATTLERWLRRQARAAIQSHIASVTTRLDVAPGRLYIMDQRTKWGNCSRLGNLSFSWRLVMAPDYVLRYMVTHETAHLAIPDHSRRFWLAVQSLCPETDQARQWLVANSDRLFIDLAEATKPTSHTIVPGTASRYSS